MHCKELENELATLAEGGLAPEAAKHLEGCSACTARLDQLKRLIVAARHAVEQAPETLVAQAMWLMGPGRRLVARLLGSGLVASGARRGEVKDFALHVGVAEYSIRLQYVPLPSGGWEVLGRAPSSEWTLTHPGGSVVSGATGRFRLVFADLGSTSFIMSKDGTEIEVPSARELIEIGA